jgi:hypothetical protein
MGVAGPGTDILAKEIPMTSKHSTGGGHSPSVGRAGGLAEAERRAGERQQNPPDDPARQGGGGQDTPQSEQAQARREAEDDRAARDASMQQGGDRGHGRGDSQLG